MTTELQEEGLTAGELVTSALELIGAVIPGQAVDAADMETGVRWLNIMIDEMSIDRSACYMRTEDTKILTVGTGQYAIGPGAADIDTVTPIRIEDCFLRDTANSNIDLPVLCNMTQEEYNALTLKTTQARPLRLFYSATNPNGTIYFDYLPDKAYEAHFFSWKPITQIEDENTALSLPAGYQAMLSYNLAAVLCEPFGKTLSQLIVVKARETMSRIAAKNAQAIKVNVNIPVGNRRRTGNIYTM